MTWRLRINGQVQGVGFRPFVWKTATEKQLTGWVANGWGGVDICVNGTADTASSFLDYLLAHAPTGSRITGASMEKTTDAPADQFVIRHSAGEGIPSLLITPDIALCAGCREAIETPGNRRHQYAFTTCTICGPRYSIISELPYDREGTSMRDFTMCPGCLAEYENPADRRFYAQTNSCPECGIRLQLDGAIAPDCSPMEAVVELWAAGHIVAVKGIGGYLLTCDATNDSTVRTLRARKRRPAKPFALMYPDVTTLLGDVSIRDGALAELTGPAAPIVLASLTEHPASGLVCSAIAPGLDKVGVMLPYAPLLALLLRAFGKPVVATSANSSRQPIVFTESGLGALSGIADAFLTHNRRIETPQDDSVVAFAGQTRVILRRARGLAPTMIVPGLDVGDRQTVAVGADLKSTFTLTYGGNLFISPYWGDLIDYDAQQRFLFHLQRTAGLFQMAPEEVVGDLHPGYFSTSLGRQLAEGWGIPFRQVQHHEAHLAAVLAENNLMERPEPVLGVIWDGTGLGTDGHVWGGEFFLFENGVVRRQSHLPYFPLLMGDKMPKEPRLSALALFGRHPDAEALLCNKFSSQEWGLYTNLLHQHQGPLTSSMGRVFDAVASLLGLIDVSSYEGEAAMRLEACARRYIQSNDRLPGNESGFNDVSSRLDGWIDALTTARLQGQTPDFWAWTFHLTLVDIIAMEADRSEASHVAFSGGVFQNALLVELIQKRLGSQYTLHFHRQLSPNDENIAFGQWAHRKFLSTEIANKQHFSTCLNNA
ncbi:MAG: carbamoyltransferase HypF [Saprospiraceae bacterium]|nr:carbamoyltransferase HypF [Saprospiraceae bacterium]